MPTTRRVMQVAGLAAGVLGTVAATARQTELGRAARRLSRRVARDVRYASGRLPGIAYRLAGRHPDPDVSDDILADRIRSSLGPLEKRLDIPHVHVMVEDHVAIVHGDVSGDRDTRAVEHAILAVSGVRGVESHLHAGLIGGDTRPSAGAAAPRPESAALRALLDAAHAAGARHPRAAVHAVLCAFSERLPDGEREQVLALLPGDARALAGPARREGERPPRVKTLAQLVAAISAEGDIEPARADAITRAVLAALRDLVPDEANDVAAVLPAELRRLWLSEPAGSRRSP